MSAPLVNIHTHRRHSEAIELVNLRVGVESSRPLSPFSAGLHPWDIGAVKSIETAIETVALLLPDAVGEIGLDWSIDTDRSIQLTVFERQLVVAVQLDRPVVIHCVRAQNDILKLLDRYHCSRVVWHNYVGSAQQVDALVERGHYLSAGYNSLHSPKTVNALKNIDIHSLFIETDDRDYPVDFAYRNVSEQLGIDYDAMVEQIYGNYLKLFEL